MNRKRAITLVAFIEGLVNLLIIVLFVMKALSLTGFIISFVFVMFITMGVLFVINRKFPE